MEPLAFSSGHGLVMFLMDKGAGIKVYNEVIAWRDGGTCDKFLGGERKITCMKSKLNSMLDCWGLDTCERLVFRRETGSGYMLSKLYQSLEHLYVVLRGNILCYEGFYIIYMIIFLVGNCNILSRENMISISCKSVITLYCKLNKTRMIGKLKKFEDDVITRVESNTLFVFVIKIAPSLIFVVNWLKWPKAVHQWLRIPENMVRGINQLALFWAENLEHCLNLVWECSFTGRGLNHVQSKIFDKTKLQLILKSPICPAYGPGHFWPVLSHLQHSMWEDFLLQNMGSFAVNWYGKINRRSW